MRPCNIPSLNQVECEGHLGKFDDCLAEALYAWSLNWVVDSAGSTDFEGHVTLVVVGGPTPTDLDTGRVVVVPTGVYLVWTASSGAVTVTEVDSEQVGQEVIDVNAERWSLWEAGCDPNTPSDHADCGDFCQKPEWVDG